MDPERWSRVGALFHGALERPPAARASFLEEACRGDDALRAQVERLLAADRGAHPLVDAFESGALQPAQESLIGREIGVFRLEERVAVGGMGVVYRATRQDGLFEQEVAVKLVRAELASETLIRRFELERRTLAALHHPNIAQLVDGGATADGRPYLVMEFVRGTPIDQYCDARRSTIEERLRLFVTVCRAVHFAHQNLVVHRDLKPSNILVDENGAPKLLDFGIARLLDAEDEEHAPGLTRTGGLILTPEYASPEQLTGGAVTTAIDVYSLGIVLYELLTGHKPYRSDSRSPLEWQRAVLERLPTRPSSLVASLESLLASEGRPATPAAELAARRGLEPRGWKRRLRGDLDRIVLMALRKEPLRRYASVRDMADDIERHFSAHPVLARADSWSYRARKFVQRNRLAVASALAVLAALVFGIFAARRGELAAEAQAEHARIEAESFESIASFLMNTILVSAEGADAGDLAAQRRRILLHAEQVRRMHAGADHLRANLLDSLGRVAQRLGLGSEAEGLIREALDIRTQTFGTDSLEYALSLRSLGLVHHARGELSAAAELFEKALLLHRTHPTETHTDVAALANDLAACRRGLGRWNDAETLHREALELRRARGPGSLDVAESLNNLAQVEMDQGRVAEALVHLEEALAIRRTILGTEDPLTLQSFSNLAPAYWISNRRDEALALLDLAEAASKTLGVDGEEGLAQLLSNKATMLIGMKRHEAAEAALDEALALQTRRLGPEHALVASTLTKSARLQELTGRTTQARATWARVLAIRRAPAQSPRALGQALCDYGLFLFGARDPTEARVALSEAIAVMQGTDLRGTAWCARAESALGEILLDEGDARAAEEHLQKALEYFAARPKEHAVELTKTRTILARCGETHAR